MSSVILIGNPIAGKASGAKLREAERLIKARGLKVETLLTARRGDAERFAREAASLSARVIIAAGGDGTCNEVINGAAGSSTPVSILPLGTTNVLARELGIPAGVEGAIDRAVNGASRKVSLGHMESGEISRFFVMMAGIGFDAEAVCRTSETLKRIALGKAAYVVAGIKGLMHWHPEELRVLADGVETEGYSLIASNISRYGGDFEVAADARIEEPMLRVFVMRGRRRLDVLRYAYAILRGRHLSLKDVSYFPAERVEVTGKARIQIDGDCAGCSPVVLRAVRDAVMLRY